MSEADGKKRIMFVLPTLPHYRNDFFASLSSALEGRYEMIVAHGTPGRDKAIRHEECSSFSTFACPAAQLTVLRFRIAWIRKLIPAFRTQSPDVVILLFNYGVMPFWYIALACLARGNPFAIWGCGHKRAQITGARLLLKERMAGFLLRRATAHICYGSSYSGELRRKGIDRERVFVAQNTINVEAILSAPWDEKHRYRELLGVDGDDPVFLFVGALIAEKNLAAALGAFKGLSDDGHRFRFFIVGEGRETARLEEAVREAGLESSVILAGPKYGADLVPYFLASDAFLLPGTGGLAINEAMAYGLPVISTEGDGTGGDLIDEGSNGFLLQTDLSNLREALLRFISLSPGERAAMGRSSREIVARRASLSGMVRSFVEAIEFMCRASGREGSTP